MYFFNTMQIVIDSFEFFELQNFNVTHAQFVLKKQKYWEICISLKYNF